MFDLLSKFGEIKEKASALKEKISTQYFDGEDSKTIVYVKVNGKKDIVDLTLKDGFSALTLSEQEAALKEALSNAMSKSESFLISEFKSIIPPIPGMNIFG